MRRRGIGIGLRLFRVRCAIGGYVFMIRGGTPRVKGKPNNICLSSKERCKYYFGISFRNPKGDVTTSTHPRLGKGTPFGAPSHAAPRGPKFVVVVYGLCMDDIQSHSDNVAASATTTPTVSRGSIKDVAKFEASINAKVRALCAARKSWATDEATELFTFIVDEYYAQLEDQPFDTGDLRKYFDRYVNLNAVNNRMADAGLITRNERGSRKVHNDLL